MNENFGISYAGKIADIRNLISAIEKSKLDWIDLSGDLLYPDLLKKYPNNSFISIDDLISPIDARNLLNQKEKLKREFLYNFEQSLNLNLGTFAKFATIDIKIEECAGDMFYYEDSLRLLKKIALILAKYNIKLSIPRRIPSTAINADQYFYRKLLTDTMMPNICLALEIYPHELMSKEKILAAVKEHRFDTGIMRIKYDTKSGNFISQTIFSCIKQSLELIPSSLPCFFDPMQYEYSLVKKEITQLSDLISSEIKS